MAPSLPFLLLSFLLALFLGLASSPSPCNASLIPRSLHDVSRSTLQDMFPNGTGIDRTLFPANFTFGALTASMKHEGAEFQDGKRENVWDVFARNDGATSDGAIPGMCGDSYNRYLNDNELVTDLGMNAFRISIAWSRLYPNGSGDVNDVAISHYNDVVDSIIEAGLEPHVTLWAQDHPQATEDSYGGPLNALFIEDFANYANTCFNAFGDRVKYWITMDEPNDYASMGYATDQNPPGRCTTCSAGNSSVEPYVVGHHLLLAHAAAAQIYKNQYQSKQGGQIGIALWLRWFEPLSNSSADLAAAKRATDFTFGWFLDPITYGDYPAIMQTIVGSRLPALTEAQSESLRQSMDFLGLNVVTAIYVTDLASSSSSGYFADMGVSMTGYKDGVAIGVGTHDFAVPWCMTKSLDYTKIYYGNPPVFITEVGWGILNNTFDNTLDDSERVEYFATYYTAMLEGMRGGADVRGAFAWSLIDGFEFNLGMATRFGLYYVDHDLQRYPRKSAFWFKAMLNPEELEESVGEKLHVTHSS